VDDIERFLEIVCREVEAVDARLELGGRPPTSPALVAHAIRDGCRLVAVFEHPPSDREAVSHKLAQLAGSFATTIETSIATSIETPLQTRIGLDRRQHGSSTSYGHVDGSARVILDEALAVLARQADALAAVVIDDRSPVVWGSSEPHPRIDDVEAAQRIVSAVAHDDELLPADVDALRGAELDPRRMAVLRAITATRSACGPRLTEAGGEFGVLARPFGGIYRLILAFDGTFPTLRAEGALRRALPAIERLVTDLPPLDPGPRGRVLSLRPRG
jgi:hypothetical protein